MTFKYSRDLELVLRPYQFILKEGVDFDDDMMDYQLMILQRHTEETLCSPENQKVKTPYFTHGEEISRSLPFKTKKPVPDIF